MSEKEKKSTKKATTTKASVKKNKNNVTKAKPKENIKKEVEEEVVVQKEDVEPEEKITVKKEKKEKFEKATLLQRFVAFIIDIFLVSLISSLIVFPFVNSEKSDKLGEESMEVIEKYANAEIDLKTYATEMTSLTYQSAKSNGVVTLITLVCEILYFVVFQLYNDGQTLGKKILNIKVVPEKGSLTMNQMICRSLIVNSILLEILSFCFMLFTSQNVYFYGVAILEMLQYLVIVISAFMIMGSKSGKGIHDLVANTRVIRL